MVDARRAAEVRWGRQVQREQPRVMAQPEDEGVRRAGHRVVVPHAESHTAQEQLQRAREQKQQERKQQRRQLTADLAAVAAAVGL